jgi:hypothetical protein
MTALVCCSGRGLAIEELKLANVEDAGKYLTDFGNVGPRELQFLESNLELLEPFLVVDTNFELRRVTEITPSFAARRRPMVRLSADVARVVQTEMLLLC